MSKMHTGRRLLVLWLGLAVCLLAGGCTIFPGRGAADPTSSVGKSRSTDAERDVALVSHEEPVDDEDEEENARRNR